MNHYANYLRQVQAKKRVIATTDIVNSQGMLVTKAGAVLDSATCAKIIKFKLMRPLENLIVIENQVDPDTLYKDIVELTKNDSSLSELHEKLCNEDLLHHCCQTFGNYDIIQQKLTVLKLELPDVYEQSLLSAYFSMICLSMKKASTGNIHKGFMAGLVHDIGLLHIDRDIFAKKQSLSSEEWRQMQSHPIIGYQILKRVENFPSDVCRAVIEHHENLDGSGYPRGSSGKELSTLGQLISLLDNIIAIYKRKFKPVKRSLNDIMPVIQMGSHNYQSSVVSMTLMLLKAISPSKLEPQKSSVVDAFTAYVQDHHLYVMSQVNTIVETNYQIGFKHKDRGLEGIQKTANNIHDITIRSGLSTTDREEWLKHIQSQNISQAYRDAEDMLLMLKEVEYQLSSYKKSATVYCSANDKSQAGKLLNKTLNLLEKAQGPEVPKLLSKHWLL